MTRELRELPLEAGLREELERYLDLIGQESRRCGEIVKNLLLFARRRGAELAPIDLNEEVGRSLMLVRHHLEISGIRLTHRPFEGDARLIADAGQLQQALVALLVNAVEAMRDAADGDGEIIVTVGASGEDLTVDIGDTGPGIPPDVLPQIFEPFYSTKDEESRVGLGLAVVYGIVRRHGGTIDVESEIGAGSVFHLRLPRRPPAAAAADEGGEEER